MKKFVEITTAVLAFVITIWLLAGFICGAQFLAPAPPAIFQVDHLSGPVSGGEGGNGMYITISGNNFGATQGTSSVGVNGVAPAQYLTWSNFQIGIQLSSSTTTGPITVTTLGGTATGPTFTVRAGNIWYVGPAADNTNPTANCTTAKTGGNTGGGPGTALGTYAAPWGFQNTIQSGTESLYAYHTVRTPVTYFNCLAAGDVWVFLDGTHYPYFDGRGLHSSLYTGDQTGGSASNPFIIEARPGANVSLGGYPTTSAHYAIRGGTTYLEVSGLNLTAFCNAPNASCIAFNGNNAGTQRFVNDNMECPWGNVPAGCIDGIGPGSAVFGVNVHNVSSQIAIGTISKEWQAMYFGTNNIEVGWNNIWDSNSFNGIQFQNPTQPGPGEANVSVHDNFITDINGSGINWSAVGFQNGTYLLGFNNIIFHVGQTANNGAAEPHSAVAFKGFANPAGCSVSCDTTVGALLMYNNTFVDTSQYLNLSSTNYACAIYDNAANQTNIIRKYFNNIFYQPSYTNTGKVNPFMCGGGVSDSQLQAAMAGSSNNVLYSASTPGDTSIFSNVSGSNNVIENPLLTSPSQPIQLWPTVSSPLNGAGTVTNAPILAFGGFEPDGLAQTNPPVIGAYLYTSSGPNPVTPLMQTTTASSITASRASAGGNVEFTGGCPITTEGTVWSTVPYPTLISHVGGGVTNDGTSSPFTSSLIGMSSNTVIFYRSYATNCVGTSYGGELPMTTGSADGPCDLNGDGVINVADVVVMVNKVLNGGLCAGSTVCGATNLQTEMLVVLNVESCPVGGP